MTRSERKNLLIAACMCDRIEFQLVRRHARRNPMVTLARRWMLPVVSVILPRKLRLLGLALRVWSARNR